MKSTKLTVELTSTEQQKIRQIYGKKNLSKIVREYLLGIEADPRKRDKPIVAITT